MKIKVLVFLGLILFPFILLAQKSGYHIDVNIKSMPNKKMYLAHYYGKGQTVYKTDSVKLNTKGIGSLHRDEDLVGGIYLLLDSSDGNFAEFILNNGDRLKLSSKSEDFRDGFEVKGSQENIDFKAYQDYLKNFERNQTMLEAQYAAAKTSQDSDAVIQKLRTKMDELNDYRMTYYEKNPNRFLSSIFGAMYEPTAPTEKHFYEDGTEDSTYAYRYFKAHYWDKFPFDDERIAYTPIYHPKIEKYMKKLVIPNPDSVSHEALWLLDTTSSAQELFNYTLWFENGFIWSSKIMGMDEAIIPIAEKYYGDPETVFWLDSAGYDKMMKKILVMQPSMIGNVSDNSRLKDRNGNIVMLHDIPSDYIAMIFWAPDCGHCRKEMPKIDSFYHAEQKSFEDIQLLAIKTQGDSTLYDQFIEENNLEDGWLHVNDDERIANLRYYFDVETTPMIVVLNRDRQIIAKKINFEDILNIVTLDQSKPNRKKK